MKAKVLILGSGFLGKQIKSDLGQNALGVSRSGAGDLNLDLNVAANFQKLPQDITNIVFAVSPDDSSVESYQKAYIDILILSLAYAKTLDALTKFIFISSTGVYGANDGSWVDEETQPNALKETSKIILAAEQLVINSKIPNTILRFGGIYGPGRNRMLELAKKGELDFTTDEYSNRIHVRDCSSMVLFAIENLQGIFIGVDQNPCTKNEVLLWLRSKMGLDNTRYSIEKAKFVIGKRCSNSKILGQGYKFKYKSYKEGYSEILL